MVNGTIEGIGSVERTIRFYRLRVQRKRTPPDDVYGDAVVRAINELDPAAGLHERALPDGRLHVAVGAKFDGYPFIEFGNVRRSAFPQVYHGKGRIEDLQIAAQAGLLDVTHFVFFGDGVVGTEVNRYGPSFAQFPGYLHHMCKEFRPKVSAAPMVRADTIDALMRMNSISLVNMEVRRSRANVLRQAQGPDSDLTSTFEAAFDLIGAGQVQIIGKPEPRGRGPAALVATRVRRLIRAASKEEVMNALDIFQVKGVDPDTGRTVSLDVLDQKLIAHATVTSVGRNRVVARDDVLRGIVTAYRDNKQQIDLAGDIALGDEDADV
jgi:hypothetical protein